MPLKKQIEDKLNIALKAKDKNTYPTLRLIVSAIKDADIILLLKKMIKQRNESCEVYKKASRNELLENEEKEIKIIGTFLPKQLNEEETKKICKDVIESVGASSMKDMGKIMSVLKSKHSDSLDFSKVSSIIKEFLNK